MSPRPSQSSTVALCAALPIPAADAGAAPDWVHMLPAGEIRTVDGRGPYRVTDPAELIRLSMQGEARLPLDENHATDLAAPQGNPAPARGWVVALESRADGIWGKVDWTAAGGRLVRGRAYRSISPVIAHRPDGTVLALLRGSLVNRPNLLGLTALHQQETTMDFLGKLRKMLGLKDDADEAAVWSALEAKMGATSTHAAQIAPIALAVGLKEDAEGGAVLQAVQALADPAKRVPADALTALQSQLSALTQSVAREKAEAAVDAAIKAGKIAAPTVMRDHYVARHMADPAAVDKELGAMISLHAQGGGSIVPPAKDKDGNLPLETEEAKLVALMGVDPVAYQKNKAAQAVREGAL